MSSAKEAMVAAGVNIDISKDDLVEMVIAEHKEGLEEQIEGLDGEVSEAELDLLKRAYTLFHARHDRFEAARTKYIKVIKELTGKAPEGSICIHLDQMPKGLGYRTADLREVGYFIQRLPRQLDQIDLDDDDDWYDEDEDNEETRAGSGLAKARLRCDGNSYQDLDLVDVAFNKTETKLLKEVMASHKYFKRLKNDRQDLHTALHKADNLGKRSKAKLVRDALSSTDEGQRLLGLLAPKKMKQLTAGK